MEVNIENVKILVDQAPNNSVTLTHVTPYGEVLTQGPCPHSPGSNRILRDETGETVLLCNMKVPARLLPIKKDQVYSVSYDEFEIVDESGHKAKMLKMVKKAKTAEEARRQLSWYVNKIAKIKNAHGLSS